jgi:hypothetical protein
MKTILSSLLVVFWSAASFASCSTNTPSRLSPVSLDNVAPCWAEAHYYGLAQDENGNNIAGCHVVLVLVKCRFGNDPAPNLVAWGFTVVGDCPQGIRVPDDVFYSSDGTQVGYAVQYQVSNNDTLKDYLTSNPSMKVVVADAAVGEIPNE